MVEVEGTFKDSIINDLDYLDIYKEYLNLDKRDLIEDYCKKKCPGSFCDTKCEVYVLIHKIVDALNHV